VSDTVTASRDAWNGAVEAAGGHLLQSWEWGEFKSRHGWQVDRVAVDNGGGFAGAQILYKRRGPVSMAYVPRGPVLADAERPRDRFLELRRRIDAACRRRRSLTLIIEQNDPLPLDGTYGDVGFVRGPGHLQPARTVKVPIDLDDDALLAQMHQKNRYSVRLAGKRGVTVERADASDAAIDAFYALLTETAARNQFGVHGRSYYADFMQTFGERALMLFAMVDGNIAAGLMAARFGREAAYMYGASSTAHRADGAAFILQYEAMKWARDAGSRSYDLWGIPKPSEVAPKEEGATGASASIGEDMRGLLNFKTRFGGEIVDYPPMMERRYVPVVSWLASRYAFGQS
jgi:lipid II:glycine glycyltransferase (peptidoglycan interpeptide bridge formation enzyme)